MILNKVFHLINRQVIVNITKKESNSHELNLKIVNEDLKNIQHLQKEKEAKKVKKAIFNFYFS